MGGITPLEAARRSRVDDAEQDDKTRQTDRGFAAVVDWPEAL
jgi:hypothetical protein